MSDVPDPAAPPARPWWRSRAAQLVLSVAVVALIALELGLTAALGSGLPDGTKNQIAAAVLLYRALTWLLPIPLGSGAGCSGARTRRGAGRPANARRGDPTTSMPSPGTVPLDPVP